MSGFTDEELRNFIEGAGGPASLARAIGYPILALKDSMVAEAEAANRLAKKMERLNLWLLVVTVAIFVLTGVLVWATFREARGQAAGGSWVLWRDTTGGGSLGPDVAPVSAWEIRQQCQQALEREIENARRIFKDSEVTVDMLSGSPRVWVSSKGTASLAMRYQCFPDTVDPRGPKGK